MKKSSALSVRRQLFGPVDHAKFHDDVIRSQRDSNQRFCHVWNFDVTNDKPLDGKYEWTPLDPASTPSFYKTRHVCFKRARVSCADHRPINKRRRLVFSDDDHSDEPPSSENDSVLDLSSASSSPAFSTSSTSPIPASVVEATPSRKKQTLISDFMKRRKKLYAEKKLPRS